jgi:biopolymer transport protein ExbB
MIWHHLGEASLPVAATFWLLLTFSVASWAIIFYRAWTAYRGRAANRLFRERFWDSASLADAAASTPQGSLAALCRELAADPVRSAGATLGASGSARERAERRARASIRRARARLATGLAALASIGSTAPFIGLFGTVWGIMDALKAIGASGSASLEVVAGPIGEALLATALGIATAVPAVLGFNYFQRQARAELDELEAFALDAIALVAQDERSAPGALR